MVVLFLVLDGRGGTLLHIEDLARGIAVATHPVLIKAGAGHWDVLEHDGTRFQKVRCFKFRRVWAVDRQLDRARTRAFKQVLDYYMPEVAHVHHLLGFAPEIAKILRLRGIPIVYSFHDYYALCPAFQLLDSDLRFCEGRCTPGTRDCPVFVRWAKHPRLKHAYVETWRERTEVMLGQCSALIFFSRASRDLVKTYFSNSIADRDRIIPHGQNPPARAAPVATLPAQPPIRVIVPGSLTPTKGLRFVERLITMNRADPGGFEFHFVGEARLADSLHGPDVILHGPYDRDQFGDLVAQIRPSFALLPSPWGETFSYVLTECWASGVPVMTFDRGALGERVRESGAGWVLPPSDVEPWYRHMLAISRDREGFDARVARVTKMREKRTSTMCEEYLTLYRHLLERYRCS